MIKRITVLVICISIAVLTQIACAQVTSPFGWREHPITGEPKFHTGVDLAADEGSQLPAMWDGVVTYADWYGGYGYAVIVYYGSDTYTLYGHCSQLIAHAGDYVKQGQIIALSGSTGNVTGPHVHLELIQNGQYIDPMQIWSKPN